MILSNFNQFPASPKPSVLIGNSKDEKLTFDAAEVRKGDAFIVREDIVKSLIDHCFSEPTASNPYPPLNIPENIRKSLQKAFQNHVDFRKEQHAKQKKAKEELQFYQNELAKHFSIPRETFPDYKEDNLKNLLKKLYKNGTINSFRHYTIERLFTLEKIAKKELEDYYNTEIALNFYLKHLKQPGFPISNEILSEYAKHERIKLYIWQKLENGTLEVSQQFKSALANTEVDWLLIDGDLYDLPCIKREEMNEQTSHQSKKRQVTAMSTAMGSVGVFNPSLKRKGNCRHSKSTDLPEGLNHRLLQHASFK